MGTYLSTHAIAVFPQSHRLNGNLTSLDSAATPRDVFLDLFADYRGILQKLACARFDIIREKGFASVTIGFVKNKGFGIIFPNPLFFYFGAKGAKLLLL